MTFATWSQTAASNTAVGGISTDGNVTLVNQIDNMFRGMMAELAVARDNGTIAAVGERGYLHGLTLSNNVPSPNNLIDIAPGECSTVDSPYWKMALGSGITKSLAAGWAVGTGNGGLDTGAVIAAATYHIWLIARSDTGVVDALFSLSATSPTMPANYDRKRRIGSIVRVGGAILAFTQVGDTFRLFNAITERSSTAALASSLFTLAGIPTGVVVAPILISELIVNLSSNASNLVGNALGGAANTVYQQAVANAAGGGYDRVLLAPVAYSNTSAQIYYGVLVNVGTISANTLSTAGWVDTRGRLS